MTRKRIAFHLTNLTSGGVEKMRLALARELIALGYDVDLVLCRVEGEYLPQVPKEARIVDLKAARTRNSLIPLIKYLRNETPDAMVVSLGPPNIIALLAGMFSGAGAPIFVTQHNALSNQTRSTATLQQKLVPWAYRALFPRAAGVLAVSEGVANDMAAVTRYPRDRIHVLYNPAYPQALEQKLSEPFADPFFDTEEPVVISVGRLIDQKGFDVLIEAISLCRRTRPVRLAILGVGPLEESLNAKAQELGISNAVALLGFKQNPLLYMKNASLFVMSSRYEGFGNVLVEAMACGTPVVSTDCESGPSEILEKGKYGALVPVDDPKALSEAILATLLQPLPAEALRSRAADFSAAKVTQRYLSVILPQA